MNKNITLSYVLTTRNKLPYLKEVMKRLLENVQSDEEIVITDGTSTDGTVEYLTELYNQGKINRFISEPDCGEAHGFNKGILLAKGELIKFLTDDDAFYYPGIQECKNYMLQNKEVDILGTVGAANTVEDPTNFFEFKSSHTEWYKTWALQSIPFTFCGLGIMFRKNSIPKIGLLHTGIVRVDYEFGLRVTSINLNFVWFTKNTFIRISNESSNSCKYLKEMISDAERCDYFYKGILPREKIIENNISQLKKPFRTQLKEKFKKIYLLYYLYNKFKLITTKTIKNEKLNNIEKQTSPIMVAENKKYNIFEAFEISNNWLENVNKKEEGEFYTKKMFD